MRYWFLLAFVLVTIVGCSAERSVCYKDSCFSVSVADSFEERRVGLMNVAHLEAESGMLFVFDEPHVYPFWMKDTLIPLDIIWFTSDGTIVHIEHSAQPCGDVCPSLNPGFSASYVLEINGGIAAELGMKPGDILRVE